MIKGRQILRPLFKQVNLTVVRVEKRNAFLQELENGTANNSHGLQVTSFQAPILLIFENPHGLVIELSRNVGLGASFKLQRWFPI